MINANLNEELISLEPLLKVSGLKVTHFGAEHKRTIFANVDLIVGKGETVGIVGESGSGKSLLTKTIMRMLPTYMTHEGKIELDGQDISSLAIGKVHNLRGNQMTLLFQDPFTMLNPVLTAGDHILEALRANRKFRNEVSKKDAKRIVLERLLEVGIHDSAVASRFPFQLSGGMRQRIALATALARDPKLLIADEPSTALDNTTQAEILALLKKVQESRQMGLILVTHDLRVAFAVCDRIYVLYAGSIVEVGPSAELEKAPLHPYTHGLLLSEPSIDRRIEVLTSIPGSVPLFDNVLDQCAFAQRCDWQKEECVGTTPQLKNVGEGHLSSCVRLQEIKNELRVDKIFRKTSDPQILNQSNLDVFSKLMPVLSIENVKKTFINSQNRKVEAIQNVSLEIAPSQCVALVGESGSGKTTLGRCVVGLETPTSGSIQLDGLLATNYDAINRDARAILRKKAQMVFQDPYSSLDPKQTIYNCLNEVLQVNGVSKNLRSKRVDVLLEQVGLPTSYKERLPESLSGGERQRVAIARALAVEPKLIVCDEAVSALDVSVQSQILSLLRKIQKDMGISLLFISHDLAVVRQIADKVFVMQNGLIVESGDVDDVLSRPQNEFTKKLLSSVPSSASNLAEKNSISTSQKNRKS
jgi:peptide/nickel transport system ATP-binding protein